MAAGGDSLNTTDTYVLGLDFGTLSARAALFHLPDGELCVQAVKEYPHGVMDRYFTAPSGIQTPLPANWALQYPTDYLTTMEQTVRLAISGIDPETVVGIGVDFTASTPLPVYRDGTPLALHPTFLAEPHAYCKLWKHHAAQPYADRINQTAAARGEAWLADYGGKISSEWLLPKLYQLAAECPAVYRAMDAFVEAGDWIVWQLTGRRTASACMAGYKDANSPSSGYPTADFLSAVDPILRNAAKKWQFPVTPIGSRAGTLTREWAEKLGLPEGCPVGIAVIDGHAAVAASGICHEGEMLMIMGTSTCHMLVQKEHRQIPGISGAVFNGMVPGLWGYEAGQCCVGDHFSWFCENALPASYVEEAAEAGVSIHTLLSRRAAGLQPGESGLLALDWWNGNRSILADGELSGLLIGMQLTTRPEDIYRALVEATAFGTRRILENYREYGLSIDSLTASGGIAERNPFMMQLYADITDMEITVTHGNSVRGAAIYGALAAGENGFPDYASAVEHMCGNVCAHFRPRSENREPYDALYAEYLRLHDAFGRGSFDVMKTLRKIRDTY